MLEGVAAEGRILRRGNVLQLSGHDAPAVKYMSVRIYDSEAKLAVKNKGKSKGKEKKRRNYSKLYSWTDVPSS